MDEFITIIQGEDRTINLYVTDKSEKPFDLTGLTGAELRIVKTDGTALSKTLGSGLTLISATAGHITAVLTDADTALVKVGERQSFDLVLDFGTTRRKVIFEKRLTVKKVTV